MPGVPDGGMGACERLMPLMEPIGSSVSSQIDEWDCVGQAAGMGEYYGIMTHRGSAAWRWRRP